MSQFYQHQEAPTAFPAVPAPYKEGTLWLLGLGKVRINKTSFECTPTVLYLWPSKPLASHVNRGYKSSPGNLNSLVLKGQQNYNWQNQGVREKRGLMEAEWK